MFVCSRGLKKCLEAKSCILYVKAQEAQARGIIAKTSGTSSSRR
jgi:hypothetical protein